MNLAIDLRRPVITEHPIPWRAVERRSAQGALGSTVLLLPFTGVSSQERKRQTATLIVESVNTAI
jgi:hypothetical protein